MKLLLLTLTLLLAQRSMANIVDGNYVTQDKRYTAHVEAIQHNGGWVQTVEFDEQPFLHKIRSTRYLMDEPKGTVPAPHGLFQTLVQTKFDPVLPIYYEELMTKRSIFKVVTYNHGTLVFYFEN